MNYDGKDVRAEHEGCPHIRFKCTWQLAYEADIIIIYDYMNDMIFDKYKEKDSPAKCAVIHVYF